MERCRFTPEGKIAKHPRLAGNWRDFVSSEDMKSLINKIEDSHFVNNFEVRESTPDGVFLSKYDFWQDASSEEIHGRQIEVRRIGDGGPIAAHSAEFESERDFQLYSWLCRLPEPQKLNVDFGQSKEWLKVHCPDRVAAYEVTKLSQPLLDSKVVQGLTIFNGPKIYASALSKGRSPDNKGDVDQTPSMVAKTKQLEVSTSSSWASNLANQNVIQSIRESVIIHGADAELTYRAIKPKYSEKRLNKPIAELLDQPLSIVDPLIGDERRFYLERAIDSGMNQEYSYSYNWKGIDWNFDVAIAYLTGHNECMAIISETTEQAKLWKSLEAAGAI